MGDSDDTYDFSALAPFLERLRAGDDVVVGNRFRGGIAPGAMPALHRYFGNPFFSLVARIVFGVPLGDVYCGLRGMSRAALDRLDLQSSGMESALEMLVKAKLLGMRISEVPTTLSPDRRGRPSHLDTWRDGRRSLLLYLASMPDWVLLYPGLALLGLGLVGGAVLVTGPVTIHGFRFDIHTLLVCGVAVLLGAQLVVACHRPALPDGHREAPPSPAPLHGLALAPQAGIRPCRRGCTRPSRARRDSADRAPLGAPLLRQPRPLPDDARSPSRRSRRSRWAFSWRSRPYS